MPELDSHTLQEGVPDGVKERVAPWHACGPASGWKRYGEAMKRYGYLRLLGVKVRLGVGDGDVEGAARQWEDLFGVGRVGKGELGFTNARMLFLEVRDGEREGLDEIIIGVERKTRLEETLQKARTEGLEVIPEAEGEGGTFAMLGVRWRMLLMDARPVKSQL